MQETQVQSLVWEDPTRGATKPMRHNFRAPLPQPESSPRSLQPEESLRGTKTQCGPKEKYKEEQTPSVRTERIEKENQTKYKVK